MAQLLSLFNKNCHSHYSHCFFYFCQMFVQKMQHETLWWVCYYMKSYNTIVQASINITIMWKLLLTFVTLSLCKTFYWFCCCLKIVNICMQKHLLFLFSCKILFLFIPTSKLHHHSQVMLAPLLLFYLFFY
jgi:hypothetical protein